MGWPVAPAKVVWAFEDPAGTADLDFFFFLAV
jgi:hypothetical protein